MPLCLILHEDLNKEAPNFLQLSRRKRHYLIDRSSIERKRFKFKISQFILILILRKLLKK